MGILVQEHNVILNYTCINIAAVFYIVLLWLKIVFYML